MKRIYLNEITDGFLPILYINKVRQETKNIKDESYYLIEEDIEELINFLPNKLPFILWKIAVDIF